MEPALCRTCGSLNFTPKGEIVPEVVRWDCEHHHPIYWHTREAREVSAKEIKAIQREWLNNE